ncbi:MAG: glycosyltransferase family 4 protein [Planctomycetota bacterium]
MFRDLPAAADVVLFVKFLPPLLQLQEIAIQSKIVYCPIDFYGNVIDIEHDADRLCLCESIVVHAPRLIPYFQSYATTTYLDHHLKYTLPTRQEVINDGPLLWVGVRSNLGPLVNYVNCHTLPAPLMILTNSEQPSESQDPGSYGLNSLNEIQIANWSPETHLYWLGQCRAALDIKGDDFRARHKPAAKALDFLASGVPLAMNIESSSSEAVRKLGFEIASPDDPERWLSAEYAAQTRTFGLRISREFSSTRLTKQWQEVLGKIAGSRRQRRVVVSTGIPIRVTVQTAPQRRTRVAIVSALFNWPSTGGGTVHTAETARFLTRAGYDVRHFVLQYDGWKVGRVTESVDWQLEYLKFSDSDWCGEAIARRTREQVALFQPDAIIITDSWNLKPRLAAALREWPCYLRLAAQECLCPLNNVRLLWDQAAGFTSCPQQQLAAPETCRSCVQQRGSQSGGLHVAERELAGFFDDDYAACLRESFAAAAGVLVVNPAIGTQVQPYARQVHVIPSGFDPERFPHPDLPVLPADGRLRLLFAGLVNEPMKGFAVLHDACRKLWAIRQDFRLLATADPPGAVDDFTESVGWHGQMKLAELIRRSDVVVCPTVAEEALGRTAVEGMAAGRPVIASRIGGLPYTLIDEETGLLCEPGNPADLARQIARLLDDSKLRIQLGVAGRQRFEDHYTWPVILERHYRPLLGNPLRPLAIGGGL